MHFRETARAKVNLTLRVLGRRPDGYHELESLVAFAGVGDVVTLTPGRGARIDVSGAFAGDIVGENLLAGALMLLREQDAGLPLGHVHLEKNLPVAAGLGGGSADAAALLRAVRRANPGRSAAVGWHEVAAQLGADVPVCLGGVPAVMRGIGNLIQPLRLPVIDAVLVNPGLPLPTAEVFRALAAPAVDAGPRGCASVGPFGDVASLLAHVRERGNDLEAPASALLPVIGEVKAALRGLPGCGAVAMSGSGPTCFGLYEDRGDAARAAETLQRRHPGWWIVATQLGAHDAHPA